MSLDDDSEINRDSDSYPMPPPCHPSSSSTVPPPDGSVPPQHACPQDREIRRLRRDHDALAMEVRIQGKEGVELKSAIRSLVSTTERLEETVSRFTEAVMTSGKKSVGEKIADAAIHWIVPAILAAVLWLLVASGQVAGARIAQPITSPAPAAGTTH